MKQFFILLFALCGMLADAEAPSKKKSAGPSLWDEVVSFFDTQKVTLDTKLIDANKKVSSLYTKQEGVANRGEMRSPWGYESSISFYMDVDKMLEGVKS